MPLRPFAAQFLEIPDNQRFNRSNLEHIGASLDDAIETMGAFTEWPVTERREVQLTDEEIA